MSDDARAVSARTGSQRLFWITAVLALLLVFSVLLLAPRGIATGDELTGTDVEVELTEGVTATVEPELRDLGWRSSSLMLSNRLRLHTTIVNDSEELFPRWYRVEVFEAGNVVDGEDLRIQTTDTLHTAHLAPGEQATTDFTYRYGRPCGEFVARISYYLTLEEGESSHVDVPLTVGTEHCLAGR